MNEALANGIGHQDLAIQWSDLVTPSEGEDKKNRWWRDDHHHVGSGGESRCGGWQTVLWCPAVKLSQDKPTH